ncbi:MAG: TonB-dependent receptor, partial [Bacteroidota bacterium]
LCRSCGGEEKQAQPTGQKRQKVSHGAGGVSMSGGTILRATRTRKLPGAVDYVAVTSAPTVRRTCVTLARYLAAAFLNRFTPPCMRCILPLLGFVLLLTSCASPDAGPTSTYASDNRTSFTIDFADDDATRALLGEGSITGSDASVGLETIDGEGALRVATLTEFSDAFIDLEALFGYPIDFSDARYLAVRMMVPEFNLPNFFSYLKVRGGVSRVGNEATPYLTQNTFVINDNVGFQNLNAQFPFTNGNGSFNGVNANRRQANPELSPEFTTEYEAGTEMRFLDGRIGLDFTYYDRRSTDQIVAIDVPNSTGFGTRVTNLGEVQNYGVEIGLDLTPVNLPNGFRWNIYTAFTRNRNEVLDLGDLEQVVVDGFAELSIVHRPGFPAGQILSQDWLRYDEETGEVGNVGVPLVNANSGKALENPDLQIIGDPNPDFLVGVTNTISFKGITITALIDYQHGGDMYSHSADQMLSRGVLNDELVTDRTPVIAATGFIGTQSGPTLDENGNLQPTNVIIPRNDFVFFDGWAAGGVDWHSVYDRTTIRLREVTLGYTLPASLLDKLPFGSASITFSGRNLWYNAPNFPDALNMDPEVSGLGVQDGPSQGLELMGVPTTRRIGVNISLTF